MDLIQHDGSHRRHIDQTPHQRGAPLQPVWRSNPRSHEARYEYLAPYIREKDCLDVGCASGVNHKDWLHARLGQVTKSLVGVDLDGERVALANSLGFSCIVADAETMKLDREFDVIVAGEIIEHLGRPGAFLDAAWAHLSERGRLILTTPNAFAMSNFVYRCLGTPRVNGDHVAWYCPVTLTQLLERHHFYVEKIDYIGHRTPGGARRVMTSAIRRMVPQPLRWGTLTAVAGKCPADLV